MRSLGVNSWPGCTRWIGAALLPPAFLITPSLAVQGGADYSVALRETYDEDIFRTGQGGAEDYLTTLSLSAGWTGQTPRSSTRFQYLPEYRAYARFDTLDHLDQRFDSAWQFSPGRRSRVGLRQGFARARQQAGFVDFEGGTAQPITPLNWRNSWDFEPSYTLALSRRWDLSTRASYRIQRFQSEDLVDSTQTGLEVSTTSLVGRGQRIGGLLRGDAYSFDEQAVSSEQADRFLRAEAIWTRDVGRILSWRAGSGFFRASGPGVGAAVKPTLSLNMSWGFPLTRVLVGYDLGYSSSGGLGGVSRSQTAGLGLSRRWGRALQTSVRTTYLSRESLGEEFGALENINGHSADLDVSYTWVTGLGAAFHYTLVRQERSTATELDYQVVAVSMTYTPTRHRKQTGSAPAPGEAR